MVVCANDTIGRYRDFTLTRFAAKRGKSTSPLKGEVKSAILHRINPVTRDRAPELRASMTPLERLLWARLRDRRLENFRFRRQHPIGPYITDFYCPSAQLIIEIDGDSHAHQEEHDQRRTLWLNSNGYRVIRFTNDDVVNNLDGVMEVIWAECLQATSSL